MSEARAQVFLERRGFSVHRYSKKERRASKTPDFRVLRGDEVVFLAEVKAIAEDKEFESALDAAAQGTIVASGGKDTGLDRVQRKIAEAWEQFTAVDPFHSLPRVVLFVSQDPTSDWGYLMDVLTGCFYADDGFRYPIYAKYSEGKISEKKLQIDLFIWVQGDKSRLCFTQGAPFEARLQSLFGVDPAGVCDLSAPPLGPN